MLFLVGLLGVAGIAMALTPSLEEDDEEHLVSGGDDADNTFAEATSWGDGSEDENSLIGVAAAALEAQSGPETPENTLAGSSGDDTLIGNQMDDSIVGNAGADELLGEGGDDTIDGGSGDDIVSGEDGNDVLIGGEGDDALHARSGNDLLLGGDGEDTLLGGDGDDTLFGEDNSEDYLIGGGGDDVLLIGQGDHVYGGHGEDTFFLENIVQEVTDNSDSVQEAAVFSDFNSDEDALILFVGPEQANAELSLVVSEEDPSQCELRLAGQTLALLSTESAPDLDDISIFVNEVSV